MKIGDCSKYETRPFTTWRIIIGFVEGERHSGRDVMRNGVGTGFMVSMVR